MSNTVKKEKSSKIFTTPWKLWVKKALKVENIFNPLKNRSKNHEN